MALEVEVETWGTRGKRRYRNVEFQVGTSVVEQRMKILKCTRGTWMLHARLEGLVLSFARWTSSRAPVAIL